MYIKSLRRHLSLLIFVFSSLLFSSLLFSLLTFILFLFSILFPFQKGWTPLHFASENGHTDTVILLLNRGANLKAKHKVMLVYSAAICLTNCYIHLQCNCCAMNMKSGIYISLEIEYTRFKKIIFRFLRPYFSICNIVFL